MFKAAIVKLTLWYVLIIVLLSLLFSGVLYHFTTNELSEGLHNQYQALVNNDYDSDNRGVVNAELNRRSQHLLRDLVYLNIVVLLGSIVISYLLARRTLRPIELAHQAQIRFTAEASHQLRTPITAMKADTEATLMSASTDPAVLQQTLKDNLLDLDKLEKLTNHLLEASRYKSQADLATDIIGLDTMAQEVLKPFKRKIADKQLTLTVDWAPVRIEANPQAIQQLLTTVIDNAVKYSQPNGAIQVAVAQQGQTAIITVRDTGIGIGADDLAHVFEPFYRAQAAASHQATSGYGLGLPLAKEIVELYNGSIELKSVIHQGTEVVIKLPLATSV